MISLHRKQGIRAILIIIDAIETVDKVSSNLIIIDTPDAHPLTSVVDKVRRSADTAIDVAIRLAHYRAPALVQMAMADSGHIVILEDQVTELKDWEVGEPDSSQRQSAYDQETPL